MYETNKMPLPQRLVSPVKLSQSHDTDHGTRDTLADTSIIVLGNIINQLENISDHAMDIISNISVECQNINNRTSSLISRVDKVKEGVASYSTEAKVNADILEDPVIRPHAKMDFQLFSPETRPRFE